MMNAWNVYRPRENWFYFWDTVFFADGIDANEVYLSLVNHDGYPKDIIVRPEKEGA